MSAEAGLVMNLLIGNGAWTILSVVLTKLIPIQNRMCIALNCFQDGMTLSGILLTGWMAILVLIWIGCLFNYWVTKNNQAISNQVI
jgi:hypothetical protein